MEFAAAILEQQIDAIATASTIGQQMGFPDPIYLTLVHGRSIAPHLASL